MKESCIVHPPESRFALLRPHYVELCRGNVVAGLLLAIFEYWTNHCIAHNDQLLEPEALWFYRTRDGFIEDLADGFGKDAVQKALNELLKSGLVERRRNPRHKWDRVWQWRLNVAAVQAQIPHSKGKADIRLCNGGNPPIERRESAMQYKTTIEREGLMARGPDNGNLARASIRGPVSEPLPGLGEPPTAAVPRLKFAGRPVDPAAWDLSLAALQAYNEQAGTKLRPITSKGVLSEAAKRVYGRVVNYPDITLDEHRDIIRRTLASKWWGDNPPTIGVVYGEKVFEDNITRQPTPRQSKEADRQERNARRLARLAQSVGQEP